jgi:hypothetical protein
MNWIIEVAKLGSQTAIIVIAIVLVIAVVKLLLAKGGNGNGNQVLKIILENIAASIEANTRVLVELKDCNLSHIKEAEMHRAYTIERLKIQEDGHREIAKLQQEQIVAMLNMANSFEKTMQNVIRDVFRQMREEFQNNRAIK